MNQVFDRRLNPSLINTHFRPEMGERRLVMIGNLQPSFTRICVITVVALSALLLGINPGWTQTQNVAAVTQSSEEQNATPTPPAAAVPSAKATQISVPPAGRFPISGIRPEMVVPLGERFNLSDIELKNIEAKELELKDMFDERKRILSIKERERVFGIGFFSIANVTNLHSIIHSRPITDEYRLGRGDELIIRITGMRQETLTPKIDERGSIPLPSSSPFIQGKTIIEARQVIRDNLLQIYKNINVDTEISKLGQFGVYVVGEVKNQGIYSVAGNFTIMDLMYLCGGPTVNGTFRNITLARVQMGAKENEVREESYVIDLYKMMIDGDMTQNFYLRPGDVVIVPPVGKTFGVYGEVKRPARYEYSEEMTIEQALGYAGGFTPKAQHERLNVQRLGKNNQITLMRVDYTDAAQREQPVQDGDLILVFPRSPIVGESISIIGNVVLPGDYALVPGMKLSDLLSKAGGVLPGTYKSNVEILRFVSDVRRKVISVSLGDDFLPDKDNDIPLAEWDIVKIFKEDDILERPVVAIAGEAVNPGYYAMRDNMRVSNLISAASGVTHRAYLDSAELIRTDTSGQVRVLPVNLQDILRNPNSQENVLLQNLDVLRIHSLPDKMAGITVQVEGRVKVPGAYFLPQNATVNEVIARAGGYREDAFEPGIILTRQSLMETEDTFRRSLQEEQETELLRLQAALSESAVVDDQQKMILRAQEFRKRILAILANKIVQGRVIFDNGRDDPVLKDGDRVVVPSKPETVMVLGAVYNSGSLIYQSGASLQDYLNKVGGLTPFADESQIHIFRPNGMVSRTGNGSLEIGLGDIIVVPPKLEVFSQAQPPDASKN
ncbi:MAG: SLBB domain-containing protein [bacterium]